jgi:hypothetical protein
VTALSRQPGHGAMSRSSPADDDTAESCQRWHCRSDLVVALPLTMLM